MLFGIGVLLIVVIDRFMGMDGLAVDVEMEFDGFMYSCIVLSNDLDVHGMGYLGFVWTVLVEEKAINDVCPPQ